MRRCTNTTHVFSMSARCAASAFHSGVPDTPVASSSATCSGCRSTHVCTMTSASAESTRAPSAMKTAAQDCGSDRDVQASTGARMQLDGQQAVPAGAATHRLGWWRCNGGRHAYAAIRPPAAAVPAWTVDTIRTVGAGHSQKGSESALCMSPTWIKHAHGIPG